MEDRAPTRGEKMVGLTFNPSGDAKVNLVKTKFAEIIDLMWELRKDSTNSHDRDTMADIAIQSAITAQMWAVKAITYRD